MKKHLEKHPSDQEWMDYLYDEMASAEKTALEAHVKDCPPCQEKRDGMRGTQRSLDEWQVIVPAKHEFTAPWQPALKWAAAAVLLVTTAFATARISRPTVDIAALQAQLAKPLEARVEQEVQRASEQALAAVKEKLRLELAVKFQEIADKAVAEATANNKRQLDELSATLAVLRDQDRNALASALEEYEEQRLADYLKFRADLERVALFSQSVAQFASYSPATEGEPQDESQIEPEN